MLRYLNSFLHSARAIGIAGLLGLTVAAAAAGSAIAQQTGSLPAQTVIDCLLDGLRRQAASLLCYGRTGADRLANSQ